MHKQACTALFCVICGVCHGYYPLVFFFPRFPVSPVPRLASHRPTSHPSAHRAGYAWPCTVVARSPDCDDALALARKCECECGRGRGCGRARSEAACYVAFFLVLRLLACKNKTQTNKQVHAQSLPKPAFTLNDLFVFFFVVIYRAPAVHLDTPNCI